MNCKKSHKRFTLPKAYPLINRWTASIPRLLRKIKRYSAHWHESSLTRLDVPVDHASRKQNLDWLYFHHLVANNSFCKLENINITITDYILKQERIQIKINSTATTVRQEVTTDFLKRSDTFRKITPHVIMSKRNCFKGEEWHLYCTGYFFSLGTTL